MAMAWTSSAFLKMEKGEVDYRLSQTEMSLVAAIPFCGRFFSPIPMGYMMDWTGRRGCLIFGRILQIVHWLLIYFSRRTWVIYLARLLNGWFSGMALFVIPVYVSETTLSSIRGKTAAILNLQFILGTVFESSIGPFVSYDLLILTSVSVDFFLFIFMFFIPETPYFYVKTGLLAKAEMSLKWLREKEDVSEELGRIERNIRRQMSRETGYLDIFKTKASRKAFFIMEMLVIIQRCSGMTALIPYGSFVMPDTWWLPNDRGPILLNATYFFMCAFSGYFVDSWGRKKFLMLSSAGTMVFMFGTGLWFYVRTDPDYDTEGTEWLGITFLLLQASFYSMGFFYIPSLIMGELFPMNIKAKANALVAMTAVGVSAVIIWIFLPICHNYGLHVNFFIYTSAGFIGLIYSSTIVETKGKTLEAIQFMLEGRSETSLASGVSR